MKTIYVASYGKGDDKGIYIVSFNEETLELKKIQQILTQDFPSYLIAKNKELYVSLMIISISLLLIIMLVQQLLIN